MKKILFIMMTMTCLPSTNVCAQNSQVFIKITNDNFFSHCFEDCDVNGDGIVTFDEANKATKLVLDRGGRSNIIEDYSFLKHFPNLTIFSVGNTPVETLDLSCLGKLEHLGLMNAAWLKKLVLAADCNPEITYPTGDAKVEVTHAAKEQMIMFKDSGIKDFCLRNKVDANHDGEISVPEAEMLTRLSFMNFRSFIRNIKDYEDLKYFPNIEYFHAGMTYLETVDLSSCKKLKEVDLSDCRMLKTVVLAKGCKPEIKYPVAYKGEQAKVIYK